MYLHQVKALPHTHVKCLLEALIFGTCKKNIIMVNELFEKIGKKLAICSTFRHIIRIYSFFQVTGQNM